jgi:hypothetical protein
MRSKSILIFLALFAAQLFATSVIPMSVEQLTVSSSYIVRARALSSESAWDSEHAHIYTFTHFQPLESLKGTASSEIVVRQMGGRVGNIEQRVSGVRRWNAGDESVLFLRPSEVGNGVMAVVGLFQGNFAVKRVGATEAIASNGVPDAMQFDSASGSITHFRAAQITLSQLRQRVARVAGR